MLGPCQVGTWGHTGSCGHRRGVLRQTLAVLAFELATAVCSPRTRFMTVSRSSTLGGLCAHPSTCWRQSSTRRQSSSTSGDGINADRRRTTTSMVSLARASRFETWGTILSSTLSGEMASKRQRSTLLPSRLEECVVHAHEDICSNKLPFGLLRGHVGTLVRVKRRPFVATATSVRVVKAWKDRQHPASVHTGPEDLDGQGRETGRAQPFLMAAFEAVMARGLRARR